MKLMWTVILGCCCIVILGSLLLLGAQTIKFTEIGSTNGFKEIDIPVQIVKSPEDLNVK